MKKSLLFIITIIIFLTSCADTPNEVKDEISKYKGSEQTEINSDLTYVKYKELQSNTLASLEKNYGQFTVSDKVVFSQPEEINIMEFMPINGFMLKSQKALELFFTRDFINSQELLTNENSVYFYNDKDKAYGGVEDNGFIAALKPEAFDISFSYSEPNIKIYHPNRNEKLNDKYQLNNGTCSVGEAVDYVNNWLYSNYKPLLSEYDYKVNTVIVREHNGKHLFQFLVEAVYNGVVLDSYTRQDEIINEDLIEMTNIDYGIQLQMININSIDSFTNLWGMIKPCEIESISEVISLESVLKLCERTFTNFKEIEISDVRIMYTLIPVYSNDELGNKHIVSYSSRPVWELIIDVSPEEFLAKGETNTYGDMRKYIYVDMVTGEIKYNLDIVKQGIGG